MSLGARTVVIEDSWFWKMLNWLSCRPFGDDGLRIEELDGFLALALLGECSLPVDGVCGPVRHDGGYGSLKMLKGSITGDATLVGSETSRSFSGSDDRPKESYHEEFVRDFRRRLSRDAGEDGYLVAKMGRRIGRQAETMPMLHSTSIHSPTLVDVHVMSESFRSARKGIRTMLATQTLRNFSQEMNTPWIYLQATQYE